MASLRAQTFTDWVCELHNDAPDDESPRRLVDECGDPRVLYRPHEKNWGAVAGFRHAYTGGPEPYVSLLEDDNWWEPGFLTSALAALSARPDAALVWANMRLWREEADGRWTDLQRTIWAIDASTPAVREFRWPEVYQAFDALHSQGAMVWRAHAFSAIPADTPLAIVEAVRERATTAPLLLLPAPLANFAVTRSTARSTDRAGWLQCKLLLSCSFFLRIPVDRDRQAALWQTHRSRQPRDTGILFLTALVLRRWGWLRYAGAGDWFAFLRGIVVHPRVTLRALRFRRDRASLWSWLLANPSPPAGNATPPARATVREKSASTAS